MIKSSGNTQLGYGNITPSHRVRELNDRGDVLPARRGLDLQQQPDNSEHETNEKKRKVSSQTESKSRRLIGHAPDDQIVTKESKYDDKHDLSKTEQVSSHKLKNEHKNSKSEPNPKIVASMKNLQKANEKKLRLKELSNYRRITLAKRLEARKQKFS